MIAPQQAIAADSDCLGFFFVGEVVVRPPPFYSLWSWRPLGVA